MAPRQRALARGKWRITPDVYRIGGRFSTELRRFLIS
jgi:hypothetical protein